MIVSRIVKVVPYNPNWKKIFSLESKALYLIFGKEIIEIHHIGSTSIPNIYAKPIIDMMPVVKNIENIDSFDNTMIKSNYIPLKENGIPGRRYFIKGTRIHRTHHIHMFQKGDPSIEKHLNFRDYLIAHNNEAQAYSNLKKELIQKFSQNIDSYIDGKDQFIKEIDTKAKEWRKAKENP